MAAAVLKNEDTLSIRLLFEDEAVIMVPVFAKKKGRPEASLFQHKSTTSLGILPTRTEGESALRICRLQISRLHNRLPEGLRNRKGNQTR